MQLNVQKVTTKKIITFMMNIMHGYFSDEL